MQLTCFLFTPEAVISLRSAIRIAIDLFNDRFVRSIQKTAFIQIPLRQTLLLRWDGPW